MKIALVGSRSITSKEIVLSALYATIHKYTPKSVAVISGGAKGVDTVAREIAKDEGFDFILFKPYHMIDTTVEYDPKFFFTRNKQIVDNSDVVVVVWDGESHGTQHVIDYCRKRKKPFELFTVGAQ